MRLINASTLQLEGPFYGSNWPKYAILSHTWGADELCLQDMATIQRQIYRGGFAKIKDSASQALRDGYTHVWVDTVCIDKTSSAELSEAINSMYGWYARAEVCYVLLEDFPAADLALRANEDLLARCRWFTRGWTLQELIAPKDVRFFNSAWTLLGNKTAGSRMAELLEQITKIDAYTLAGRSPRRRSVACRMAWAAHRQTARPEDRAYCLLGLFGINLPMLYGEGGESAFFRLQKEILERTDDQSIFTWDAEMDNDSSSQDGSHSDDHVVTESGYWGLLAPSPRFFRNAGDHVPVRLNMADAAGPPVSVTSRGIAVRVYLNSQQSWAVLACKTPRINVCIPIVRLGSGPKDYARRRKKQTPVEERPPQTFQTTVESIFVPHNIHRADFAMENVVDYMRLSLSPRLMRHYGLRDSCSDPAEIYNPSRGGYQLSPFLDATYAHFVQFEPAQNSTKVPFILGAFLQGDPEAGCYRARFQVYGGTRQCPWDTPSNAAAHWSAKGKPWALPDWPVTDNTGYHWRLDQTIAIEVVVVDLGNHIMDPMPTMAVRLVDA